MKYICDATQGRTWFRFETETEAEQESAAMDHKVSKHFQRARDAAAQSFKPASTVFIEQKIGLEAHIQREMPLFLTLRDKDGEGLVTAMLPPGGREGRTIIVGKGNSDPYPEHKADIEALATHVGRALDRNRCFPYG